MKEILKLVSVLTVISGAAGILLAYTNKVTAAPIARARQAERLLALAEVLPPFDNEPQTNTNAVSDGGRTWVFYVARKDGRYAGAAVECSSRRGYGGAISLVVGLDADDRVRKVKITEQHETPGLGTKVALPDFTDKFGGQAVEGILWRVKKDGGTFDAVTGATISSRAVVEAIRGGIEAYRTRRDALRATGA